MEFTSGIIATLDNEDKTLHIAVTYMTNGRDYTVYQVIANTPEHRYWTHYTDKQEALNDYMDQYQKLFNR